jgi:hypothetical protein
MKLDLRESPAVKRVMSSDPPRERVQPEVLYVGPAVGPASAVPTLSVRVTALGPRADSVVSRAASVEAASDLWFRTSGHPITPLFDAVVPALLPMAMVRGASLTMDAPITRGVLRSAEKVQDLLNVWWPHWHRVGIESTRTQPTAQCKPTDSQCGARQAQAAFFSGGVDSFYTLLQHHERLTHLIFVQGFDIPVSRTDAFAPAQAAVRQVADELGLTLIEVATNLRALTDPWVPWDLQCGAAMAAVAHLLAPGFDRILIPSSYSTACLFPYGSHPGLDPLWSTPALQIVHDGCEASRFDKVRAIGRWALARQHLRVCWQNTPGAYNCCACRKCQWTMLYLRASGDLDEHQRFAAPLDLEALAGFPIDNDDHRYRLMQVLSALQGGACRDPALESAVRALLQRSRTSPAPSMANRLKRRLRASLDTLGLKP